MQGVIGLAVAIPAFVGMYFTWRSLSRWLKKRGSSSPGQYAAYAVILLALLGASPALFPGNLKYIAGVAWVGFVLVGVKHLAGWANAVKRHETENLQFAEAAMAAAARVANADGTIQEEEKATVHQLLTGLPELAEFSHKTLYGLFEKHCGELKNGPVGLITTERAIAAVKDDPGAAAAVMQVGVAVAKADNNFEDSEKKALSDIASILGLDPSVYVNA